MLTPCVTRTSAPGTSSKVKNDPVVIAARQAKQSANTPEARHAAEEALHKASREAMVKADPLIAPILDKLHPPGPGGFVEGAPQTNAESMMQSQ